MIQDFVENAHMKIKPYGASRIITVRFGSVAIVESGRQKKWNPGHAVWSRGQIIQNTANCNCEFHKNAPLESDSVQDEATPLEEVIKPEILVDGVVREVEWGVPMIIKVDDLEENDLRWCRTCHRSVQRILRIFNPDCVIWKCGICQVATARRWRPWSRNYVEDKIEEWEATSMMAIKKVTTADDQGTVEPVPPPMPPQEQRHSGSCERCSQFCEVGSCPCGGTYPCVERRGHQWQPHRCEVKRGIASGPAFSHGIPSDHVHAGGSSAAAAAASAVNEKDIPATDFLANNKEQRESQDPVDVALIFVKLSVVLAKVLICVWDILDIDGNHIGAGAYLKVPQDLPQVRVLHQTVLVLAAAVQHQLQQQSRARGTLQ
jgi:hypothetical protein